MPAGAVGRVWAEASWLDTVWEAGVWEDDPVVEPLYLRLRDVGMSGPTLRDVGMSGPTLRDATIEPM